MKKLKRYRLKINPKDGSVVDFISLVDSPAIERNFLKFNNIEKFQLSEDKMELFGPVLIPDMPIYRRNEDLGEYEIVFKAEDIKEIQMEFMKQGFQHNVNLDHKDKMADSYVFGFFQSSELIPNPESFNDLPLGTLYAHVKVENEQIWSDIKSGKRNGFSIEGIFNYITEEFENKFLKKQETDTTNIIEGQEKITLEIMIKDLFRKIFTELSEELDEKKDVLEVQKVDSAKYKIESREVGQKVEVTDADGKLIPASDGDYEFEDGFKFTVKDGLIASIDGEVATTDKVEEAKVEEVEVKAADNYQEQIDGLKKEIEDLKNLIGLAPTQESMTQEFQSLKLEFKNIFEKFTKVPAEPSKVIKNNVVKDEEKKKFDEFLKSLRQK